MFAVGLSQDAISIQICSPHVQARPHTAKSDLLRSMIRNMIRYEITGAFLQSLVAGSFVQGQMS